MIIVFILVPLALVFIFIFNRLILLRNRLKNGFHQIDVQLERRADLIPNLVETVKGYVKHEKGTLEAVIRARSMVQNAKKLSDMAEANTMLTSALKSLFALSESYPQLKANENFLRLQEEITTTENQIAFSRQFYNDYAMKYNTAIQSFPQNMVAVLTGFKPADYFKVSSKAKKQPPKVKF
jgi:LemA protein